MPDPHIRAAFYLSATLDQWWRWEDNAQVLSWRDGSTIAFVAEIDSVLSRLAPQGLPPFGAITLLLAACRDRWLQWEGRKELTAWAEATSGVRDPRPVSGTASATGVPQLPGRVQEMTRLLAGLDAVARLPKNLRDSPAAKALLAEVVFEGSRNRGSAEDAAFVLRAIRDGISPDTLRPHLSLREASNQFAHVVAGVADGLARVDAASLAHRLETGLDGPVRPAEQELAPPQKVRQLLAELRDDDELSGLARLAHDLMAAVAVPRSLRHREELPLGGVSDLTNRGSLDRLLISELAQDDLTLAVRVAVNEAMYLRRESPPKEPPHYRLILIDAGIRTWGVPRVFATAVALALAATVDPKAKLKVFRASGEGIVPVDLTTKAGLTDHLAALETAAHAGEALPAFAQAIRSTEADGLADAFVLSQADAVADADFAAAVRQAGLPSIYIGAVDRDGSFRLVARTRAGERPIRSATLSLDELVNPKRPKRPRVDLPLVDPAGGRDEWPAIFFADPFPLLLPHHADPSRSRRFGDGSVVTATEDGRLLLISSGTSGAAQLCSDLPRGQLRLIVVDPDDRMAYALFVRGQETSASLVQASLDQSGSRTIPIQLRELAPDAAFTRGAYLFVVGRARVDAYAIRDGRHAAGAIYPHGIRWHRGRFFRDGGGFLVIAFDGTDTLKFERLPTPIPVHDVFDREDSGYWFILQSRICDQSMANAISLPSHLSPQYLKDISADGHRLFFQSAAGRGRGFVFDLQKTDGADQACSASSWDYLRLGVGSQATTGYQIPVIKKVTRVGVDGGGDLVLFHHGKKIARRLTFTNAIRCVISSRETPLHAVRSFERYRSSAVRVKQSVARWPDGSAAWLDSRGLLHLRSGDRTIPELSIVLRDGGPANAPAHAAAAWSSQGKWIGPRYFIGDAPVADIEHFSDIVRRFVRRLRE